MSEAEEKVEEVKPQADAESAPSAEVEAKATAVAKEKSDAAAESGKETSATAEAEGSASAAPVPAVKKTRVKGGKYVPVGIVHIKASFNNTQVSISDPRGAVISWSNAGRCGFKGSRKSTAYAATMVAQEAARVAVSHGMHEVEVKVQGPGAGRESAIRAVQAAGLAVTSIKDMTPIPHNGCRSPKRRRV
ncbi:MAG: 30S ribosomal protein S11 [Kiritimatiellae bacterium]|nr:30S ribosomal protein S11 [Kiritimatiellia bacterium]MDD4737136.1 30S ribosomal protein S11 [Kiritimatiellia bacterium]